MPLPPPPNAALTTSGYPIRSACPLARLTSTDSAVPGTIGTPAESAARRGESNLRWFLGTLAVLLTDLDLERALAVAGLAAPVRSDEVTSSTNDIARSMAEEGTPEWTLVATAHQTAGRGRLDRAWQDAAG